MTSSEDSLSLKPPDSPVIGILAGMVFMRKLQGISYVKTYNQNPIPGCVHVHGEYNGASVPCGVIRRYKTHAIPV